MDRIRWRNIEMARSAYESGAPRTGDGPIEAFFEIAARCNLRCRMCAIVYDDRYRNNSGRPAIFAPELFERLASAFPTIVRAYLFGLGEPVLNPHLPEYVHRLASSGAEVWFNTNATLIDDEKADAIAAAGAERITVSIDGATRGTYERIRRGARFDDVIRGIRALVAAERRYGRPKVNLSFVAMRSNIDELPLMADLCAQLGATGVHVEPLYSQQQADLEEHYREENLATIDRVRLQALFAETLRRADAGGISIASRFLSGDGSFDYVERAPTLGVSWTCTEPWSSIWVTAAGEVRTCCINETSFGNLFEQPFEEIWNGAPFQRFRAEHAGGASVPSGCDNCIRNGRPRHSPYFRAVAPVTYRPLEFPLADIAPPVEITFPATGATVTDPLIVAGRVEETIAPRAEWELIIDHDRVADIDFASCTASGHFAVYGAAPFLTEGAHVIWFRERGRSDLRGWGHREVFFWRDGSADGTVAATSLAALELHGGTGGVIVTIDGSAWDRYTLLERPEAPRLLLVDTSRLTPGDHDIAVHMIQAPVARFRVKRLDTTGAQRPPFG